MQAKFESQYILHTLVTFQNLFILLYVIMNPVQISLLFERLFRLLSFFFRNLYRALLHHSGWEVLQDASSSTDFSLVLKRNHVSGSSLQHKIQSTQTVGDFPSRLDQELIRMTGRFSFGSSSPLSSRWSLTKWQCVFQSAVDVRFNNLERSMCNLEGNLATLNQIVHLILDLLGGAETVLMYKIQQASSD